MSLPATLVQIDRYRALLDTCVLAPMPVADTLLRLAELPVFFTPRWSQDILDELHRTLTKRFQYTEKQVGRRISSMTAAFPEAMVDGYEALVASMTNHPKDRHVLAAAVRCGADCIVSDNVKHFPRGSLAPYGLECIHPDDFFAHQYQLNPEAFSAVLREQAADIHWSLPQLLARHVPSLSKLITLR